MPVLQSSKRIARAQGARALVFVLLLMLLLASGLPRVSHATLQSSAASNASSQKKASREIVPGEVLVRFRTSGGVDKEQTGVGQASVLSSRSGEQIPFALERLEAGREEIEGLRVARVAPENTWNAIRTLRARADVLYAEPNYVEHTEALPNDPLFSSLYALRNTGQDGGSAGADIRAEPAWNITTGSRNVVVGVIDQGVDINHPDLVNNIWTNPGETGTDDSGRDKATNGVDDDGDGLVDDVHGWDFLNNDNSLYDGASLSDHGTHVSGIIGAQGNNGQGVVGVNWQVTLLPLKFLGPQGGTDEDAIRAILYAKTLRDMWDSSGGRKGANVRILNNSWGGGGYSQAVYDAIQAASDSGILFVAAAGNDSTDNDTFPHYPSGYKVSNVISVGSTDRFDKASSFSNFGAYDVDIAAPGSGIYSTTPNGTYNYMSGTSMATPYVSGVAALISAANPGISLRALRSSIVYSGDVLSSLAGKNFTGSRLNALAALQSATENDAVPPGAITDLHIRAQSERLATLEWTAPGDDGNSGTASLYIFSFVDQASGAETVMGHSRPSTAGTQQTVTLKAPFRHSSGSFRIRTFDNVGNEGPQANQPITVSSVVTEAYSFGDSSASALTEGGSGFGIDGDDRLIENYALPFSFPFYGVRYSAVTLSTNGNIYFSAPPRRDNGDADDVPGSIAGLNSHRMIAGMWDDLDLRKCFRPDADIYVVKPSADRIIFRWQGVSFTSSKCPATPGTDNLVNFEVELQSTGQIVTRYGSGNLGLHPVVGISNGEPDAYISASHTSEKSALGLSNAPAVTFNALPFCNFALSSAGITLGPNAQSGTVSVTTGADCQWTPVSDASWITITGTSTSGLGGGSGSINYTVAANNGASARTGSVMAGGQRFIITQSAGPAPGQPADDAQFFVRQHYLDFLGREPDEDGLGYWSGEITRCGSDPDCLNSRRVGVSAAFFVENEYQQTGSFVYRLYKGALGRQPSYAEFSADRLRIVAGADLEANKAALLANFVGRKAFTDKYSVGAATAEAFVDQLLDTLRQSSGADLSSQRASLIDTYNAAGSAQAGRAAAVRASIENAAFKQAVYNPSFVLMQYFGYLHRDPEEGGYLFWLDVLNNREPGNYRGMVCSFITSAEYQQRFGQSLTRTNRDCSSIR